MYTQFHPRSPNAPKNQQRVAKSIRSPIPSTRGPQRARFSRGGVEGHPMHPRISRGSPNLSARRYPSTRGPHRARFFAWWGGRSPNLPKNRQRVANRPKYETQRFPRCAALTDRFLPAFTVANIKRINQLKSKMRKFLDPVPAVLRVSVASVGRVVQPSPFTSSTTASDPAFRSLEIS
jgi:hypothetical protein